MIPFIRRSRVFPKERLRGHRGQSGTGDGRIIGPDECLADSPVTMQLRPWKRRFRAGRHGPRPFRYIIPTSPVTASRLLLALRVRKQPRCQKCRRHGIRWTGLFAFLSHSRWTSSFDSSFFRSRLPVILSAPAWPDDGKYPVLVGRSNSAGHGLLIGDQL